MIYLRNFSQTDQFTNEFMRNITNALMEAKRLSYLQGFVLTYDPRWSALGRWLRMGGVNRPPWSPDVPIPIPDPLLAMIANPAPEQYFTGEYDDSRLWQAWEKWGGGRNPFLAKVCLTPTTPDTRLLRTTLEQICAAQLSFTAVCEDRQRARFLTLEGGRSVTAGTNPGTVGGFLKDLNDPSRTIRGITCGHVGQAIPQTVTMQDTGGIARAVGTVSHTNWVLVATPPGVLCNNQGTGPANDVDIALLELSPGEIPTSAVRGIGNITDIFRLAQLGSGHNVMMSGAISGANKYFITGYLVTYSIPYQGNFYCFRDLFEIAGIASPTYFGAFGTFIPVPQGGDSGGWVCCPDPNGDQALCGMLIAGDNNRGYCCFTDQMENWASTHRISLAPL
jgi:hypothetical protein